MDDFLTVDVEIPQREMANSFIGQRNVGLTRMWLCGVDVAYPLLSDWTRLQGHCTATASSTRSRRVHSLHEGWRRSSNQITLEFLVTILFTAAALRAMQSVARSSKQGCLSYPD